MALFVITIFGRVWRNLQRFSRVAGEIRRRNVRAGSFSAQNSVPELAGVAAEIDGMVSELRKLSHAAENSASAVLIFDAQGRIANANSAQAGLHGVAVPDLIRRRRRPLPGRAPRLAPLPQQ